ncbi:MAG: hypothetical protein M3Z25_23740 [Actinomycetota bacterium]|nr:hypothetical protein [Actinomycetota bacterium]
MTTTPCPVCGTPFTPIRRQRFCRPACRQTAYRRAHQPEPPPVTVPAARTRTETTIYQCGQCDQRYLAEQWCHDCHRPCIRVGPGGECPHCNEPVAVTDLLPTPKEPGHIN